MATINNLHVKLQQEDRELLAAVRDRHAHDTDSQTVRVLIRQEARRLGLFEGPAADTMPPGGRPRKRPKKAQ